MTLKEAKKGQRIIIAQNTCSHSFPIGKKFYIANIVKPKNNNRGCNRGGNREVTIYLSTQKGKEASLSYVKLADIKLFPETIPQFKKEITELQEQIKEYKEKIKFLQENKLKTYDEGPIFVLKILKDKKINYKTAEEIYSQLTRKLLWD